MLFEPIGETGQRRLAKARAVLFGCGALGTVIADTLVRAGVGYLRICDRDFIERDNLQRQVLFDEQDIAANLPKAEAAVAKLRRINSDITVEAVVVDVNASNVAQLADGTELMLDGTDNFETRYLINDLSVQSGRAWIYGAVVGAAGLSMVVIPTETPCLRCVFEEAPPADANPTCDTAGVLGPAVHLVAAFQSVEAIKFLSGAKDAINRRLVSIDAWTGRVTHLNVQSGRKPGDCPCCGRREFPFLNGELGTTTTTLCGRDAVQVNIANAGPVDFAALAERLARVATGPVQHGPFLLRASIDGYQFTIFNDGRAIIKGTDDKHKARTLYAKYVGA